MTGCWRILAVAVIGSVLIPSASSQCPRGVVAVQGRVENLPPEATNLSITATLKTSKGDFSKTAAVTDGQFTVDVAFSTLKSWSPIWGHHCSNLPRSVTLKVSEGDKAIAERGLDFKKSFEQQDSNTYRLKEDLRIDLSETQKAKS